MDTNTPGTLAENQPLDPKRIRRCITDEMHRRLYR
jgi:F420-0:gamma-glutamyl ligase-like protein